MIAAETYTQLVTNLPHIGAEITWDIALDIIGLPFLILWRKRHDRRVHGVDTGRNALKENPVPRALTRHSGGS